MYTVHECVGEDMEETLRRIACMGYRAVEFYGEPADFEADEVRNALLRNGLVLAGWHVEWHNFAEECLERTIQYLKAVECPVAVVPCLGGEWNVGHAKERECKEIWLDYINRLNQLQNRLAQEGIRLAYHNHAHEFQLQYDGQSVFDLLFENLSADIILELDTGNCIQCGGDPVKILQKNRNRDIILHLKPYSRDNGFHTVLGWAGDANDWQEILYKNDIDYKWLLIESENRSLTELENAELCIQGLNKQLKD